MNTGTSADITGRKSPHNTAHNEINARRLFLLSCIALIVTSMTFAIRAGMMTDLGNEFSLSKSQLGWMASMAFIGFPAATVIGGLLYNSIGPKNIMILAFLGHLLGLGLTIVSGGFFGLILSTFFVGFANGSVEAGANPMIADLYPDNRTTMLNKFHVWFPGGLVIGALAALAIKKLFGGSGASTWQLEIAIMLIPTFIYGWMVFTTKFPDIKASSTLNTDTKANAMAMLSPLFILMCFLMTVTATTELGTQQWVGPLLEGSGASGLVVLAMVSLIMAFGRYFAGPLIQAFNPIGVLLFSAVFSAIGIFLLSIASGGMVYLAAVIFAVGVCYFWPTMVGFISEYMPQTGALGMSVLGGFGLLGLSFWQPVIGGWLDTEKTKALDAGLTSATAEIAAGQATLSKILTFPIILIIAFLVLFLLRKRFVGGSSNDT